MLVRRLQIFKLHKEYSYDVSFDPELTFLYGTNGCGKTTLLNILVTIVTGRLYRLSDYEFDYIVLEYAERAEGKTEKIEIKMTKDRERGSRDMFITFLGGQETICDIDHIMEKFSRKMEDEDPDSLFAQIYPPSKEIRKLFNYVYLPLSRYGEEIPEQLEYVMYLRRNRIANRHANTYHTYLNGSMEQVAQLVRQRCIEINVRENDINNSFRDELLVSAMSLSEGMPFHKIFNEIDAYKWNDVERTKEFYIKTLKDIGVYNSQLEKQIETFFSEFQKSYDKNQNRDKKEHKIEVDYAWMYSEYLKIKSIAELAKKNETKKEQNRQSIEIFIDVINGFFQSSGSDKTIQISNEGQIIFRSGHRHLKPENLSSGEKQIVITFASLIFGLKEGDMGLFIVDEPEASLHLEWQSKFVPAILETNQSVQLIFATHAPELIGRYQDKAVKLVAMKEMRV